MTGCPRNRLQARKLDRPTDCLRNNRQLEYKLITDAVVVLAGFGTSISAHYVDPLLPPRIARIRFVGTSRESRTRSLQNE